MGEHGVLILLGAILLAAMVHLARLDNRRALRLWTGGFVWLYVAGLLTALAPPLWVTVGVAVASPLFVALMTAGAIDFAGRSVPRWLMPAAVGLALTRLTLDLQGQSLASGLVTAAGELSLFLAAGVLVWRAARANSAGLAEHLLGPCFVLMGALDLVSIFARLQTGDTSAMVLPWLGVAYAMALLQIFSGFERVRRKESLRTRELDEQRRTLSAILDIAPLDIVMLDDDGRMRMANRKAVSHMLPSVTAFDPGSAERAVVESHCDEMRRRPLFKSPYVRVKRDRNLVIRDLEIELDDGSGETLQLFSSPVLSETGERLGRVWMSRNVTAEKELERQLRVAQKLETLGTLAGGVAHDFNNQLTTILGNAELLAEALADGPPLARRALTDLERAASYCAELTRGLLSFARRAPIAPRRMRIEPVLAEVEALLKPLIPAGISLRVELGERLWQLEADGVQLQQVLVNLAMNARDAVADGGSIVITVHNRRVTAPAAVVGSARPGCFLELEVHDDGQGIPAEHRERIFDPFFTTKEVGQGTGLGLAIVYGVVRSHAGWIEVDSRPGSTSFRVYLPAIEPQESTSRS